MLTVSLILIGMSNVGKSYWMKLFTLYGYTCVSIDDEIAKRLGPWLEKQGYSGGIADVAKWMGQPFEPQYKKNSRLYLKYERREMWRVVWRILKGEKLIVDTTGSVIYTGWFLLFILQMIARIVLLDAPETHVAKLYKSYIAEPKPVIWGDKTYVLRRGEDPMAVLKVSYPNLLRTRNRRYYRLAHVVLDYSMIRSPGMNVTEFLNLAA